MYKEALSKDLLRIGQAAPFTEVFSRRHISFAAGFDNSAFIVAAARGSSAVMAATIFFVATPLAP